MTIFYLLVALFSSTAFLAAAPSASDNLKALEAGLHTTMQRGFVSAPDTDAEPAQATVQRDDKRWLLRHDCTNPHKRIILWAAAFTAAFGVINASYYLLVSRHSHE